MPKTQAPAATQILERLRKAIMNGDLRSGQPLRQDDLAAHFGTSKIPVREALQRLEGEGLVKSFPHRGVFVTELSADELQEICEIRVDLESRALKLAIKNLDKETIDRARKILDEAESANDYLTSWSARNWAFHATIYAEANRPRLLQMIETLHGHTERYLQLHVSILDYRKKGEKEHRDLLKFAARGETQKAVALLSSHIDNVYTMLKPYLSRRGPNSFAQL